MHGVMLVK